MIKTAMILAAGKGTRMRASAQDPPKPLTQIGGQSLLFRMLARLENAGLETVVVNVHHKAEAIEAALSSYPAKAKIIVSDERVERRRRFPASPRAGAFGSR
jgi:MurNAc alpha-1-phosphate uridylyltransferase